MGELLTIDSTLKSLLRENKDNEARELLLTIDASLLNTLYYRYCRYQTADTKDVMAGRIIRAMSAERY